MRVELILLNGERRTFDLPSASGTVANALDRLDDWIRTSDGGWVQKSFIVEVRADLGEDSPTGGSEHEYEALDAAAGELADKRPGDPQTG